MTLIGRIEAIFIFFMIVLPISSLATVAGSKSCTKNQFWSTPNGCCLPIGGPTVTPPAPPKGSACPPSSHYWGEKQGCCVPRFPPPEGGPDPQCPQNWVWNKTVRKCDPAPTPSQPHNPEPSKHHGGNHGNSHEGSKQRRSAQLKSRSAPLCPTGLDACPISGAKGGDYECLDTTVELQSCGGCASLNSGQDCTAIPGAWNVGCEQGSCVVYSCSGGYKRSLDGQSCIAI